MDTKIDIYTEVKIILFCLKNRALHVLVRPASERLQNVFPSRSLSAAYTLEENAQQCLYDLLAHNEIYLEQLFTYGDQQNKDHQRILSVVYFALLPINKTDLRNQEFIWVPVSEHGNLNDHENQMLEYALRRLRYKLEYTAIGFELLPETFSLTDLQHTYEIVLDEALDKRNFRRRILQANIIEPTPYRKTGEGRPATLYRYRSDAVAEIKTRRLFP